MYCPECGEENEDNAKFCNECGNKLLIVEKKQGIEKFDVKSINWKAILIGLILGFFGILFTNGFFLYKIGFSIFLLILIGGVVGFIAGGSWEKGVLHGGMAYIAVLIIFMIFPFGSSLFILKSVMIVILGVIGGALGAWIKVEIK